MPPTIAQTAGDVFDAIAASPIADLLGTLKIDGTSQPGLLIAGDGETVEGLRSASGVVVVVSRDRSTRSEPLMAGSYAVQSFAVRALQFGKPPHQLDAVADALAALFPGVRLSPIGGPVPLAGHGQLVATLAGPVVVNLP